MSVTISSMAAIALAALVLTVGPPSSAYGQDQPIYGRQLMTEQERLEYRERMRAATTEQEREQIRLEHHARMRERAKEMARCVAERAAHDGHGRTRHGERHWDKVRAWVWVNAG